MYVCFIFPPPQMIEFLIAEYPRVAAERASVLKLELFAKGRVETTPANM
jgi:hypothetical protein